MINYFRMKKAEWKIKAILFGVIVGIIDNQEEILNLFQKMFIALKDVPTEDLQKELVAKLAEIIHAENKDKTE